MTRPADRHARGLLGRVGLASLGALAPLSLEGCTALYPEEPLPADLAEGGAPAVVMDMDIISVAPPDQDTSPYVPLISARPCPVSDDDWQRATGFTLPPIDAPAAEGLSPNVSTFSCPEAGCATLDLSPTLASDVPWLAGALSGEPVPAVEALKAALRPNDFGDRRLPLPITRFEACAEGFEFMASDVAGVSGVCGIYEMDIATLPAGELTSGVPAQGVSVAITRSLELGQAEGLWLSDGVLTVSNPLQVIDPSLPFDLTVSRSIVRLSQPIMVGPGSRVEISEATLYQENNAAPIFTLSGGEVVLRDVLIISEGSAFTLRSGRLDARGVVVLTHPSSPPRAFNPNAPLLDMSATTLDATAQLSGLYVAEGLRGPVVRHSFGALSLAGVVTEPIAELLNLSTVVPDLRLSLKNAYIRAARALTASLPNAPAGDADLCAAPAPPQDLAGPSGVTLSALHIEGAPEGSPPLAPAAGEAQVTVLSGQLRLRALSTRDATLSVEAGALSLQEAQLTDSHIALRQPSSALRLLNVRAREEDPLEPRALIENASGEAIARHLTWEGGATLIEHPEQAAPSNARAVSSVCHARLTQGAAPPFRPVVIAAEGDVNLTHVIGTAYEGFIASKGGSEGEVTLRDVSISSAPRALQEGLRERPMSLISVMSSALTIENASLSTSVVHNTTIAVNNTTQLSLDAVNLLNIPLVGVTRLNRDLGPIGLTSVHKLHIQAPDTSPLFDLHPVAFLSDEGLVIEHSAADLSLSRIYSSTGSVLFNATGADRYTAEQRLRLWESGFVCHNAFYLLDCDDTSREPYKPVCDIAPSSSPEPIQFP